MATATVIQRTHTQDAAARRVSTSDLIRLSGLGLVLAGLLIAFFPILHPNHDPAGYANPIWVPVHLMPTGMAVLALFGLMSLFARQGERNGRFGVVAFVAAILGTALLLTGTDVEAFIIPFIGLNAPQVMDGPPPIGQIIAWAAAGLIFAVGYVLQGIAVIRAGVLPRAAGALLVVGGLGLGIGAATTGMLPPVLLLGSLLFGMALAWLGYSLWSEPSR
ncbi:MAG: hypothetical protein M3069_19025 [Chloroflexota bacterium]|nr:hypothetical protein [Chloroflexota bacterium]